MNIQINFSIKEFSAEQWDMLWPRNYPFTRHGFLNALEASHSINSETHRETGWQPMYVSVWENNTLISALPTFLKMHSYGEYVFDWSWANAYHQAGLDYYPKIVNAVPFTPATGPRVGFDPSLPHETRINIYAKIFDTLLQFAEQHQCSGLHCLFPNETDRTYFETPNFCKRLGYQFHWFNQNYHDFEMFLEHFSSRKRKNLRKERVKVRDQGVEISMKPAADVSEAEWEIFSELYQITYLKRSGHGGYLGKNFFKLCARAIPENLLLSTAYHKGEMIAAALYFRDDTTLYGRYWGSRVDIDGLHFECCYYQGIEYAINNQLKRFDPGAQGEHKIQRGFTPVLTQSFHWVAHPTFRPAIHTFVEQEAIDVQRYINDCRTSLPFKAGTPIVASHTLIG